MKIHVHVQHCLKQISGYSETKCSTQQLTFVIICNEHVNVSGLKVECSVQILWKFPGQFPCLFGTRRGGALENQLPRVGARSLQRTEETMYNADGV